MDTVEKVLASIGKRATIITIVAQTIPKMRKSLEIDGVKTPNPYYGNIIKVSRVNGFVNWSYEKVVNRQREREGSTPDFESLPRSWGERIAGTPFVEHKGIKYLELKVQKSIEYSYQYVSGEEIPNKDIEKWLPKKSESSRQDLEKQVMLRDYTLSNILEIHINGRVHTVGKRSTSIS